MTTKDKLKDFGILILRIGIGLVFVVIHGWPKIAGGSEMWTRLGGAMKNLGITFYPEAWGFMSAFAEFGGGILLLLGLFTRPIAFIMAFNMFVATMMHFSKLDAWGTISHPLTLFAVFFALIFIGAGKYSLDHLIFRTKQVVVKEVEELPKLRRAG